MARALQAVPQLGFDEKTIEDASLHAALDELWRRKEELKDPRRMHRAAKDIANAKVEQLDLGEGTAVRVGPYRIKRSVATAHHVEFDTEPKSRVSISRPKKG